MKMKKIILFAAVFVFSMIFTTSASALCTKIKDGILKDSYNRTLVLGFDEFGYNYQARMFNGTYDSVDRVLDNRYYGSSGDYVNDKLTMKWSDDWLSNMDCDGDGKLDRGGDSGVTNISKGWTTNHVEGDYITTDGESHHYTYFAKFVWVGPAPGGIDPWGATRLWGQYASIEEVYNDPDGGYHGVDRSRMADPAGLGFYTN